MAMTKTYSELSQRVHDFVRKDFSLSFGETVPTARSDPRWQKFRDVGTELWLDSGDIEAVSGIWTKEFSALTTNNTLLNREIQTGQYDQLIGEAVKLLNDFPELSERQRLLELGFILNATHALRLVERFDAFVSVEEHTDLANDLESAVEYAQRYYRICPERFYIKIPFTPAGLLATRRVRQQGIPVNHTLGFSARENYVIARLAQPTFVNVFLGRLNSFVAGNDLGNGDYIGEKATLASQAAIRKLRKEYGIGTRQIGASFRSWDQYVSLAGIDVMTAPPKVASQLLERGTFPEIASCIDRIYPPGIKSGLDPKRVQLDTLWDIDDDLISCVDAIEQEDLDAFDPQELIDFFGSHGCSDFLVPWSESEIQTSRDEGKIPKLDNWREALADGAIGLDSLMNLAGLNSFRADQEAMDNHIRQVWR